MIAWVVFAVIFVADAVATVRFVPAEYRQRYADCPKGRVYWVALSLWHGIWVVSLIENAVAPSNTFPAWARVLGAVSMICGHALFIWARRVNPFFVPAIVRPDYVVTAWPYSRIYHPGYTALALTAGGACFLLGSVYALFLYFPYACLLAYRMYVEDRLLSESIFQ